MGKPLITQRRGKGSPSFKAPSHRFAARAKYRSYDEKEREGRVLGEVTGFVNDPARSAVLMKIKFEDGENIYLPAAEGVNIGALVEAGAGANVLLGNILPLEKIPEGYPIFNIEVKPGDGGAAVRSSGGCAYVVSKETDRVLIKLPSKKMKYLNAKCRATIGCAAGGGRLEKPLLKAGKGYYKHLARGHWYPTVRGVKMNVYDHPFGGKQHHGAVLMKGVGGAPGQHVGSFGARRTGRKKRKGE